MKLQIGLYGKNEWNLKEMEWMVRTYGYITREEPDIQLFTEMEPVFRALEQKRLDLLFCDEALEAEGLLTYLVREEYRTALYCMVDFKGEKYRSQPVSNGYYLEKPFQQETFMKVVYSMVRECRKLNSGRHAKLVIKHDYRDLSLSCGSIVYINKLREEFFVHMRDGSTYNSYGALKRLMPKLPTGMFFKTGGGCIVNLHYVTEVKRYKTVVRCAGKRVELPLCRNMFHALVDAKKRYDSEEKLEKE